MSRSLLERAHQLEELARARGADAVRVSVTRARQVAVRWRDGELERLEDQTRSGAILELFVAGRYALSSTSDLRHDALGRFVDESIALARLLEPDPARGLPDAAQYPDPATLARDLDLFDPCQARVTSSDRLEQARSLETCVRDHAGPAPIASVTGWVSDAFSEAARVHSNGFEATRATTTFTRGASVHLEQSDGRRPLGISHSARRHAVDLRPIDAVAHDALGRALRRMDSRKLPTHHYTVVVENRAVGRLLRPLLGPLHGAALQQKASLWDGKLGQPIADPRLTLIDDPFRPRGFGAALWDSDGLVTRRRPILENGVLRTYLIDLYYARKLGVEPTGGDLHDLEWACGAGDLTTLAREVGDGVLLDQFIGGNHDATTGELSVGCSGHRIRAGEVSEPVAELNLTANLGDLWKRLTALGGDPDPDSSLHSPSCVLENIQLCGV